jgi:hypothetical protein
MRSVLATLRSATPPALVSLGIVVATALLVAGCASSEPGIELRGHTATQLAEDRTQCLPFVQAHTETTPELAEAACLIARGYRAPLAFSQGPARIGTLYASGHEDANKMVGDFHGCNVEAFKTPMPEIKDKNTSGIFSNFFASLFPRGFFSKAITADDWALKSFVACLGRRGYEVSGVTRFR